MDPFSISTSVLAVIAATVSTIKAVNETVGRYKGRDKTLGRLQGGLNDLVHILSSLEEAAADDENPVLALLKGPVSRCAQVAREFDDAMKIFGAKSKTGLRDWARMEFMRGDINEFIDTLADYKSTISIGLGIITMHASRVTQQVVGDYNEMVKDTAYNLEIRLQRIDQKVASLAGDRPILSEESSVDLQDEKAVTMQCLRICERASSFIQSLQDENPALQREAPQQSDTYLLQQFESQLLTQKTLDQNRENLLVTMGRLQERLDSAISSGGLDRESEMLRFQQEVNMAKECLAVCNEASNQVHNQKIHIIGEVIAEDDCDQVVVTCLADLFNVAKVKAKSRTMQLVGSMPVDAFRDVIKDRYSSRFGALDGNLAAAQLDTAAGSPFVFDTREGDSSAVKSHQVQGGASVARPETTYNRPASNEVRKRRAEGEDGKK